MFVNGLFENRNDLGAFKNQLRDFLIQSKEFSAQVGSFHDNLYTDGDNQAIVYETGGTNLIWISCEETGSDWFS
jgi:hypothetical protein